jgi:hypothetical protein
MQVLSLRSILEMFFCLKRIIIIISLKKKQDLEVFRKDQKLIRRNRRKKFLPNNNHRHRANRVSNLHLNKDNHNPKKMNPHLRKKGRKYRLKFKKKRKIKINHSLFSNLSKRKQKCKRKKKNKSAIKALQHNLMIFKLTINFKRSLLKSSL